MYQQWTKKQNMSMLAKTIFLEATWATPKLANTSKTFAFQKQNQSERQQI